MTMPFERTRAVQCTEQFLKDLTDHKKTPRVPKHIRQQANHLLRHYPSEHDIWVITDRWGKPGMMECPFSKPGEGV